MKQVKAGEMLTTRLEDGWIESEVKNIQPVKNRVKGSLSQHEFNAFSISSHARADRSNLLHRRLLTPATVDGSLDKELSFQ